MRCIVFDTSTIISIATNNLLYIMKPLKKLYGGSFCMPAGVKKEIIDRPLDSKKFKLEAIQVLSEVMEGTLSLKVEPKEEVQRLMDLANSIFKAHDNYVKIIHWGEAAVLVLAKMDGADAVAIDERTTRVLIEDPSAIARILGSKMHTKITINKKNMKEFQDYIKGMEVIRSIELGVIAYEAGLLDRYVIKEASMVAQIKPRRDLLDGLLWGLKLRGASVTSKEIDDILKIEGF